jgi:signal peptidase complex subunit 2
MSKSQASETVQEEELVLFQVDTGDIVKLKQILDECVSNTFLKPSHLEAIDPRAKNIGLNEDHKLNNTKLILMATACAFAMVAQFAPVPFPESRPLLGACCAVYFLLSGVLQLIFTFVDKDCILITKPMSDSEASANLKKNPNLTKYGLRVRTIFPRFSEFYTVQIEYQNLENSPFVKQTWSVGQFFDKEGMFDEYGLQYEVEATFRRFERGDFDKVEEDATTNSQKKAKKE